MGIEMREPSRDSIEAAISDLKDGPVLFQTEEPQARVRIKFPSGEERYATPEEIERYIAPDLRHQLPKLMARTLSGEG